jgi:hypothetical protein
VSVTILCGIQKSSDMSIDARRLCIVGAALPD